MRSNVSPSKREEDAAAGAKQGTFSVLPCSSAAGSAAQEVKTRIAKLEALLKCARDAQDEDVIRAPELKLSAAHAERVCTRPMGEQLDRAMAAMEKAKLRVAKADDAVAKAVESQQAAREALAETEAHVAKVREAAATAQTGSDSPLVTQAADPELARLVQIAEAMKAQTADLPKAGQDAIQQLTDGLRRQATARAHAPRSAGMEKDAKDEEMQTPVMDLEEELAVYKRWCDAANSTEDRDMVLREMLAKRCRR